MFKKNSQKYNDWSVNIIKCHTCNITESGNWMTR